jgi:hypothetical protein
VLLTDVPAVVPLLTANILLNQLLSAPSSVSPAYDAVTHLWGTPIDALTSAAAAGPDGLSRPAIVIASDVVYDPAGFQPLLTTIQSLLLAQGPAPLVWADRVILAHRHRNPEDHQFFALVSSAESGLTITETNLDHIFARYEDGDVSLRDMKIFEITKRDERS